MPKAHTESAIMKPDVIARFVSAYLANGGDRAAALREAAPIARKWSAAAVRARALVLLQTDQVLSAIDKKRKELAGTNVAGVGELAEMLTAIARDTTAPTASRLSAMAQLARLMGYVKSNADDTGEDMAQKKWEETLDDRLARLQKGGKR
jgi:hypothetical protein